mgnify:CR=1 FL=1
MRRKDRELKDMADIVSIAKRETVCTVAFHDEPCPYLIPLNYGAEVEDGKLILYFHGAKERHNTGRDDWEFSDAMAEAVRILRLDVTELSCKEHP